MDEVIEVPIGVSAFDGNSSKKQWSFVRILVLRCTVAVATCTGQPPVFATPQPGWSHCGVWGVQSDQNGSKLPWNFFVHQLFYGNFYQWLYLMRNNGEITKCTWKIGMIPNTKSGNRGVQGWCHSAGLGLSLSFGREVAPNGTILPLQSTEQQAFFFLADFVGRGFWRFADLCSEQPTSESSEFYVVSRVQDTLADGQNRSIPCRDLHWGCLAKHGFMRYNWYVAGTHLYYTHLLCFSFYRGGLDGTATLLCTNSNLQAHIGVESLLRGVFVASLWGGTGGHFGLLAGWLPMAPSVCSGWKLVFCLGGPASPLCFASVRFGLWFQSLGT